MRRADPVLEIIGVAAAARREGDDGRDRLGILACERQRAPAAGGMADDHRAILPDEGLLRAHSPALF